MKPFTNNWFCDQIQKEQKRRREFEQDHKGVFAKIEDAIAKGTLIPPTNLEEWYFRDQVLENQTTFQINVGFAPDTSYSFLDGMKSSWKKGILTRLFTKYHLDTLRKTFPTMSDYQLMFCGNGISITCVVVMVPVPAEPDLLDVKHPCPFGLDITE